MGKKVSRIRILPNSRVFCRSNKIVVLVKSLENDVSSFVTY